MWGWMAAGGDGAWPACLFLTSCSLVTCALSPELVPCHTPGPGLTCAAADNGDSFTCISEAGREESLFGSAC